MKGKLIYSGTKILLLPLFAELAKDFRNGKLQEEPEWVDEKTFKLELNEKEFKEWKEDMKKWKYKIMLKSFSALQLHIDLFDESDKKIS